jgi:hypothetical protein
MHVMSKDTMFSIILDTEDEDYVEMLGELTLTLQNANTQLFRVECENVSWQKKSGRFTLDTDETIQLMTGWGGDYRLMVVGDTQLPTEFHATRYSHDEPTGASFTIRPALQSEMNAYEGWN